MHVISVQKTGGQWYRKRGRRTAGIHASEIFYIKKTQVHVIISVDKVDKVKEVRGTMMA